MKYYVEIRLFPDPEFPATILMNVLFAKLHRALVAGNHADIGISFPRANNNLGDILRLHGEQTALQRLMEQKWIGGLKDCIKVTEIRRVPDNCQYRIVKRAQIKSSVERLYRRSVRKGWLTAEEAEEKITQSKENRLKLPYVQLKSGSSGQSFRLFIHQGKIHDSHQDGTFSSYGLSQGANVPWF